MAHKFKILCLETKKFWGQSELDPEREPELYDSGDKADEVANYLSIRFKKKYQVRPHIVDDSWRQREEQRFREGLYIPPPWDSEYWCWNSKVWRDHYCHISVENDVRIAYTPNETAGLADRQTRQRPGAYLKQFYNRYLDSDEIRHWVAYFSILHEDIRLNIARTADEIERVYKAGPRSCMDGNHNFRHLPCHPVRMYAGPDLAVAYLEPENGKRSCGYCEENGCCTGDCGLDHSSSVTGRVVIWPERKLFSRIYGDTDRLKLALMKEGYKPTESLEGAKLAKQPAKTKHPDTGRPIAGFVAPFIDGTARYVVEDGNYLVIRKEGVLCCNQHGIVYDARPSCGVCNERYEDMPHRIMNSVNGRRDIYCCRGCYDKALRSGELVREDVSGSIAFRKDCIVLQSSKRTITVLKIYIDEQIGICAFTHQWLWMRDSNEFIYLADGTVANRQWWQENQRKTCSYCEMGIPDGTNWTCTRYTNCYEKPIWAVINDGTNMPQILAKRQLPSKDWSKYQFKLWDEAQKDLNAAVTAYYEKQRLEKEAAAKRRRSAAQKLRRERERGERLQSSGNEVSHTYFPVPGAGTGY
ncbi:MAG TPA: hypothetical protein VFR24_27620 [Candidatus Angelobacter sp.]|nr:hypothetical protein [Candidatus Angelobacter sp.]